MGNAQLKKNAVILLPHAMPCLDFHHIMNQACARHVHRLYMTMYLAISILPDILHCVYHEFILSSVTKKITFTVHKFSPLLGMLQKKWHDK